MRNTYKLGIVLLIQIGATWAACSSSTNSAPDRVEVTIAATDIDSPLDAASSSDGMTFYYLAMSNGQPALFEVPALGGTSKILHAGAPFVSPRGLVISSDDKKIYIADPKAGDAGDGVVFSVSVPDGAVSPIAMTEGMAPNALDLVVEAGMDAAYFVGAASGEPAIFRYDTQADKITEIAHGAPLVEPGGLAVDATGGVYVADRKGASATQARIFYITKSGVAPFSQPYVAGDPAGIALTVGGHDLVLSALNPETLHSEVIAVPVANGDQMSFDSGINMNTVSGGVHRARSEQLWSWAGQKTVYRIVVLPGDASTVGGPCNVAFQNK